MKKHLKFTAFERDLLAQYLAKGINKSECARRLGRPRKTVVEEIKRNSSRITLLNGKQEIRYIAISAHAKSEARKGRAKTGKHPLKNKDVYAYVVAHLRIGWSPEQIAGRLRLKHSHDKHWHICHETIYRWIYKPANIKLLKPWYEYLRRGQKRRKKQHGRKVHRSRIPERISISQRPKVVNNRIEFGHWEGDSVEGPRSKRTGLHTEVERMSRLVQATKIANLSSREAIKAQYRIFGKLPKPARRSTTLDNGKETCQHYQLRRKFDMKTYHAHPYSSWQRGTNEHGNWHLRYYFPKGTDFANITEAELQAAVNEINNRPRKILGYKTAHEVYYQLLNKELGVTINT